MKEIIVTGATIPEAVENGCQQLGIEVYKAEYEVLEQPKGLFSLFSKVKVRVYCDDDDNDISDDDADDDFLEEDTDDDELDLMETVDDSEDDESEDAVEVSENENTDVVFSEDEIQTDGIGEETIQEADTEKAAEPEDYSEATAAAVRYLSEILGLMGVRELDITAEPDGERTILNINGNDDDLGVVIGHRGDTLTALQYLVSLAANNCCKGYFKVSLNVKNFREKRERTLETVASKTAYKATKLQKNIALEPMSPYERSIIHTAVQAIEGVTSWSVGENEKRHVVIGPVGLDEGGEGMPVKYAKVGGRNGRSNYNRGGYGRSSYNRGSRSNYNNNRGGYRKNYRDGGERDSRGYRDNRGYRDDRRNNGYRNTENRTTTRTKSNYETGFTYGKIEIDNHDSEE